MWHLWNGEHVSSFSPISHITSGVQEKYLNSFKQYRMDCGNIDLHFVHERSKDPAAIPLVLLHGWPCNFTDFHKMIHPLAMPGKHSLCWHVSNT